MFASYPSVCYSWWTPRFFKLLSSANVTKACSYDGINNKIVKLCGEGLFNVFTNLINTSFRLGQYPSTWKLANVLPLCKKDDRQLKTNYRPFSFLSCLSKICEKIVFKHLYNFFYTTDFFDRVQSGFSPGDSPVMQLEYIVHKIYVALVSSLYTKVSHRKNWYFIGWSPSVTHNRFNSLDSMKYTTRRTLFTRDSFVQLWSWKSIPNSCSLYNTKVLLREGTHNIPWMKLKNLPKAGK